jgi:hypothetical protein
MLNWKVTKEKNGNWLVVPSDGNKERSFTIDNETLEPITYWWCSPQELTEVLEEIQGLKQTTKEDILNG